jgi:hypothetical protein
MSDNSDLMQLNSTLNTHIEKLRSASDSNYKQMLRWIRINERKPMGMGGYTLRYPSKIMPRKTMEEKACEIIELKAKINKLEAKLGLAQTVFAEEEYLCFVDSDRWKTVSIVA